MHERMIVDLVACNRPPATYPARESVEAWGLIAYVVNYPPIGFASIVDKIFKREARRASTLIFGPSVDVHRFVAMQLSRSSREFQCQWGALEIRNAELSSVEQVTAWQSDNISFSKAADGSLILKRSNSAIRVTGGFIPLFGVETVSWSRFAAIKPN